MSNEQYTAVIYCACLIAWLATLLPSIVFLLTSWKERRDELFSIMTDGVLESYYKQFLPSALKEGKNGPALRSAFQGSFSRQYGRRLYVPPLLLLGGLSAIGLWGVARTLRVWGGLTGADQSFSWSDVTTAALIGGFTWIISDQLTRFRTRDFTSYDVYNCVFRLLIAIPVGYSIAAFVEKKLQVPIAFLLGTFPTSSLFTIARRLGSKTLKIDDDAVNGSSELEQLPSVGKAFAERLKDEGIVSVVELAYADPVNLTIRTNKQFAYLTDCISQALLWIYIQDGLKKISALSLRGAQEVKSFMHDLNSGTADEKAAAQNTLQAAADALKIGKDELLETLGQVADDPYTLFLVKIWAGS
jgi:hypothetical protein